MDLLRLPTPTLELHRELRRAKVILNGFKKLFRVIDRLFAAVLCRLVTAHMDSAELRVL